MGAPIGSGGEATVRVSPVLVFFFKQKPAYEIETRLEFRRVLFRSCWRAGVPRRCSWLSSSARPTNARWLPRDGPASGAARQDCIAPGGIRARCARRVRTDPRSEERRVGKE